MQYIDAFELFLCVANGWFVVGGHVVHIGDSASDSVSVSDSVI